MRDFIGMVIFYSIIIWALTGSIAEKTAKKIKELEKEDK